MESFLSEAVEVLGPRLLAGMRKKLGDSFELADAYHLGDGGIFDDPTSWRRGELGAYVVCTVDGIDWGHSAAVPLPDGVRLGKAEYDRLSELFALRYGPTKEKAVV
jgi:hypothetical protein